MQRRKFLQGSLSGGALVAGAARLPRLAFAEWPKAAFESKDVDSALSSLLGSSDIADSTEIQIKAPDIAENGAVVPIQVDTGLASVESITIIADQNPAPLVASFEFGSDAVGYVSTRIKMGKTGNVVAVVKAGGKLYRAKKEVKVTIGGCGG
jgi:sulfur-oxidizing protein SoxY